MAYIERSGRVGRSQGAVIFWGLVSAFFATAFCYYFYKNHENETSANVLRDQVLTLQEQRETLNSQKDKLQSSISEAETQLKTREDFLQDKETKLAAEESRLEAMGQQSLNQTQQNQAQTAVIKKFNDTVRKLVKDDDTDVVVRGGRPVLRVPSSVFFAFGDAALKPEGKAMLTQIAQSLSGQMEGFELRMETYSDSEAETAMGANDPSVVKVNLDGKKPLEPPPDPDAKKTPLPKNRFANSWDLTGARAAALARFLHDEGSLPFQNIIVVPRADFQPIVAASKEGHARNRRVEFTIAPLPGTSHAPDPVKPSAGANASTPAHASDKTDAPAKVKKGG